MSLKDQLREDMTASMKSRDTVTTSTLRLALTALSSAETAGKKSVTLDDSAVLSVLATEAKKRHEAAGIYEQAGQSERATAERAEASVLEKYLPASLDHDEIAALIADEIAAASAAGLTGPKATGKVIAAVRAKAGAGTDGAMIAQAVKDALAV